MVFALLELLACLLVFILILIAVAIIFIFIIFVGYFYEVVTNNTYGLFHTIVERISEIEF